MTFNNLLLLDLQRVLVSFTLKLGLQFYFISLFLITPLLFIFFSGTKGREVRQNSTNASF